MNSRTILAFDLSTARGEIALARGSEVLFEATFQSERSHNAQVFEPLARALAAAGEQLDVVVVGTGPGSYTGIRIAIAAAQGVGLSRHVPVVGWPSIAAPHQEGDSFGIVGDARRGAFYLAEVEAGLLRLPIEIVDRAEALARIESAPTKKWLTFDAKKPLDFTAIEIATPSAVRLAGYVSGLTETDLQARSALPLEPQYLQEAFITTARKPGKAVPIASPQP